MPKFYLRNFATQEKPKHIGLYNYHNGIFIKEAPIKHQCCENFLYGIDDEIEAGLSKLETLTALTFQKIFESHTPPPEGTIYFAIRRQEYRLCHAYNRDMLIRNPSEYDQAYYIIPAIVPLSSF